MTTFFNRIFNKDRSQQDHHLAIEAKYSFERSRVDNKLLLAYFEGKLPTSDDFDLFLQNTLRIGIDDKISLTQECQNLARYIYFYTRLMPSELKVLYDFPVEQQNALISPFIFFPMIQNAFHYGYHVGEKYPVRIKVRSLGGSVTFEVSNHVNHHIKDQSKTEIIQLFKSRLDYEYPDRHDLILNSNSNTFKVSLCLKLMA